MNQVNLEKHNQPKVNTEKTRGLGANPKFGFSKNDSRYKNEVVCLKYEKLVDYYRRHRNETHRC